MSALIAAGDLHRGPVAKNIRSADGKQPHNTDETDQMLKKRHQKMLLTTKTTNKLQTVCQIRKNKGLTAELLKQKQVFQPDFYLID